MTANWKIILAAVIVLAVVAVLAYYEFGKNVQQYGIEEPSQTQKSATLPAATGNLDDAVNAFLTASVGEQAMLQEEESDASLINADSQAISDFGQSYNENEF